MFRDRDEAGRRLGELVRGRVERPAVVLGVPRGGVIVAVPVAEALQAPLDVVVPRKLGAPGNQELGIGAVAPGVVVLNDDLVRRLGVSEAYIEREAAQQQREVERRTSAFRGDRPPPEIAGRTVVIVDDGVATGGTVLASIAWARAQGPARVVLAVPVLPSSLLPKLGSVADDVLSLAAPRLFGSVGEWYERFPQVTDEEVRAALAADD
jgi:putative phosphoribosyl transferase